MVYRKDIQILRGIAVLLVILFHLDMAGLTSGFLGVDIFFVISGYLMAMMYRPEHQASFFLKRARRLLPAYFVTIFATTLVASWLTTPNDYQQVIGQSVFATFFAANIGFWLENSYFDKAAFKPLLHLWSLGLEIQFYLLVPLLYRLFQKHFAFFVIIWLGSLALCFWLLGLSPKTSFFWIPMRLWQFLIGFGCGYYLANRQLAHTAWPGALALLVIVLMLFVPVDGQAMNIWYGHPGLSALAISLATGVTLVFGLPKALQAHPLASVLERIGGYSYSLYLAHFPVIVLYLYQPFHGTLTHSPDAASTAALVALILLASTLLYRYVENPLRHEKAIIHFGMTAAAFMVVSGQLGTLLQIKMVDAKQMQIYQAWFDRDAYRCGKIKRLLDPMSHTCTLTDAITKPRHHVLLVGNSHADSIKATFSTVAQEKQIAVYFLAENTPLMKNGMTAPQLIQEAHHRHADAIVLHYSPEGLDQTAISELIALNRTEKLKLVLLMPVPIWNIHVPMALLAKEKTGQLPPQQTLSYYQMANHALTDYLQHQEPGALRVYPVAPSLCQPICAMQSADGRPLYFDSGHLTLTGSQHLTGVFSQILDDLG